MVSVGVCDALSKQDTVFGTYRSHALYLAKGGDLPQMIAELYGKKTGCTQGKGGSMHLIAPEAGLMGTSAIVGTTIANAVGYAYALKLQGRNSIVVSFFGDGATEEGVFAESLAFAAVHELPILFVCENNFYAIHTPLGTRQGKSQICDRARAHGLAAEQIGNGDIFFIREKTFGAVEKIRRGEGPVLLEVFAYRWCEHVGPGSDFNLGYRSRQEAEPWIKADALLQVGKLVDPAVRETIEVSVEKEIDAAFTFAEESPFPQRADLFSDVFKGE
jgi:TPP-dependent pyruvate/acetoin dehydrogenase alpha subunit